MKQIGVVTDIKENTVTVSVTRSTACGDNCASCGAKCSLKNQSVTAEYKDGIKKGDKVVFEMPSSKVIGAAFLVYITPIIILSIVYLLCRHFGLSENVSIVSAILSMILWFVIMHFIDKKLEFKHTIIEVSEGAKDVRI